MPPKQMLSQIGNTFVIPVLYPFFGGIYEKVLFIHTHVYAIFCISWYINRIRQDTIRCGDRSLQTFHVDFVTP